jgi:hypothetical protein
MENIPLLRSLPDMRKPLLSVVFLLVSGWVYAQQPRPLYSSKQTQLLEKNARLAADGEKQSYSKALELVQKRGWFADKVFANGRRVRLHGLDAKGEPVYVTTFSNVASAATTKTNSVQPGGSLGLTLSGSSAGLSGRLGVWDGGGVRLDHVELTGRVTQVDNVTTNNEHSTHVAGTMIASGVNAIAKGMSFGASLRAWDFTSDLSEMTSASSTLLISNHSYGQLAGWDQDEDGTWRWYGNDAVSETEDYKFGYYDTRARDFDKLAFSTPNYLICFASGNSRDPDNTFKPADGASYKLGSGTTTSTKSRNSNGSFDNISTYGTAKNILTVGAVYAVPNGVNQSSDIQLASFSGSGPTDDGRIKPDIMGVGVNVLSSSASAKDAYAVLSGTSMATPNVSGSLFLLQELYSQQNSGSFMRSSTLKGIVIHTATDAGNAGPDYNFGWGLLNMEKAAKVILNTDKSYSVQERELTSGQTQTIEVVASGQGPLRLTIAWIDPEATPLTIATTVLNNRTARLINDLDLRISDGTTTWQPYLLDPDKPTQAATTGDNVKDNVEQILVANPVPGKTYTVTISHKGTLVNGKQAYSLVASGIGGKAYCASSATATNISKISQVVFGGMTNTLPDGCAASQSFPDKQADIGPGQTVSFQITVANCNGQNTTKTVRLLADWNLDGDYDDTGETLGTSGSLSSGGVYNGSVTVPATVAEGQLIPLRIISVEGTTVANCGTYAGGQTQEYVLRVVKPAKDAGVTAIVSPENSFCAGNAVQVKLRVQNFGTEAQSNVPLTATIKDGSSAVATLTGQTSLSAFETKDVWLSGSFNAESGKSYTITGVSALSGDQVASNNQTEVTRTVTVAVMPQATAMTCGSDGKVTLRNAASGTAFWYDSPSGGNLLAIGNAASLGQRPASGTVYASLNEYSASIGPATKSTLGTGGYNQFSPGVNVRASIPVVLESARLYIGNSGKITFTAYTTAGVQVSTVTLDVTATRNPAASGPQTDDGADQGAVYPLGLVLPAAGDYVIQISYANGATIFRNLGSYTYPYALSNVFSITGNGAGTSQNSYYYYFYDLKVRASGCPSARVAVPVTAGSVTSPAKITPADSAFLCSGGTLTLQANTGTGFTYQWYSGSTAISGATNASLAVTAAGNYTVKVSEPSGCETTSSVTNVSLRNVATPTITRTELALVSSEASAYQWLLNGAAISGATKQNYTVTQSGTYSVRITNSQGCTAVSDGVTVTITSVATAPVSVSLTLQPNPATEMIRIDYQSPEMTGATASFYGTDGRFLQSLSLTKSGEVLSGDFRLDGLPAGLYLVRVSDSRRTLSRRFIKQ